MELVMGEMGDNGDRDPRLSRCTRRRLIGVEAMAAGDLVAG